MPNTRSLSPAPASAAAPATASAAASALAAGSARHRLRAVDRDETVDVADFLPQGATWLPAPPHTLPNLPGRPPMVGYLVLVPADQADQANQVGRQPLPPVAVPDGGRGDSADSDSGSPVRVDTTRRTAEVDGRPLDLTYLEFELLAHFVAHPHRVHTRDQLVTTVWGYGHVGDGRTVDVHVARLRRKLGPDHRRTIQTVRRVGYKYAPPAGG
ncbi:winged helix-turn-helix transcriptional regulator [Streptomyces montanus]|uniref:Winged helix-turn-helix transcriptional regulator n=1 Tax=Streptomyces montanus TaxID=2580423 RepID=A0A5R9FHX4_9ACTN|nr:winged helix-turn-helix domain-containing protein [Streptomyces montanus]TLS42811.1 winged helix-turn-helix transcriptional regulator [Streptomyces montanus]